MKRSANQTFKLPTIYTCSTAVVLLTLSFSALIPRQEQGLLAHLKNLLQLSQHFSLGVQPARPA